MKTFTQYLAEAVKEIPVRIKLATDLSDDMVETIESELARYDVVNVAKPVKTIVQEHPLDFGTKIRNAEVVIIDATIRMPMSFETFRRNLSDKLAIPYDYVVVNDDFETALSNIETIVLAQRLTLKAQASRHHDLITNLLK